MSIKIATTAVVVCALSLIPAPLFAAVAGSNPTPQARAVAGSNPTPQARAVAGSNPTPQARAVAGSNPTPQVDTEDDDSAFLEWLLSLLDVD